MGRTKKVGVTGKFGARYGKKIREDILKIGRPPKTCPNCFKPTLKRVSAGVWLCRSCNLKFAGKAYKPT